jgi:hypothetical protein
MLRTVLVLAVGLALASCSGGDDVDDRATLTAQRDGAYVRPASCTALGVEAGATVAGTALAACMDDALAAHVTGRQTIFAGQDDGIVSVTYSLGDPVGYESGGSQDLVVIGDRAWLDVQGEQVVSDPDGDATQQDAARLAATFAERRFVVDTDAVRSATRWRIGRPRDLRLRQGGTVEDAWPLSVTAPYAADGQTRVTRHVVWLDRTLSPVKVEEDATRDGSPFRSNAELYDLGEKVTVTAPQ